MGEGIQIISVPDLSWEHLTKTWGNMGWTIEPNPLANNNKVDVFCTDGTNAIRVWEIGQESDRTVLVLTKLQRKSS